MKKFSQWNKQSFGTTIYILLILLCLFSCDKKHIPLQIIEIPVVSSHSGEPNLFTSDNGEVFLSWIEYLDDTTDVLKFSKLVDDSWSAPTTISAGSDWFVNWADFPSLAVDKTGNYMAAHWLQKSAEGTYDYDVMVSTSTDGGLNWTEAFILHNDGVNAEHGFVSLLNISADTFFAVWLDGRNTKTNDTHDHSHGHHGSMSLRAAWFNNSGTVFNESELDNRVCDCCQTSAAVTDKGISVVYRDRSDEEVRDISVINYDRSINKWSESKILHSDNWKISGCPVNGPSLDSYNSNLAVSWYSIIDGEPIVRLGVSTDDGKSFNDFFRLDNGNALGRTSTLIKNEDIVYVSWIEQLDSTAQIVLSRINIDEKNKQNIELIEISDSRSSGFPRLSAYGDDILICWTDGFENTIIKTALVKLNT